MNHNTRFTHLIVHSQYSIDQGILKTEEIVSTLNSDVFREGFSITDTNTFAGVVRFSAMCFAKQIKAIYGCKVLIRINDTVGYTVLLCEGPW